MRPFSAKNLVATGLSLLSASLVAGTVVIRNDSDSPWQIVRTSSLFAHPLPDSATAWDGTAIAPNTQVDLEVQQRSLGEFELRDKDGASCLLRVTTECRWDKDRAVFDSWVDALESDGAQVGTALKPIPAGFAIFRPAFSRKAAVPAKTATLAAQPEQGLVVESKEDKNRLVLTVEEGTAPEGMTETKLEATAIPGYLIVESKEDKNRLVRAVEEGVAPEEMAVPRTSPEDVEHALENARMYLEELAFRRTMASGSGEHLRLALASAGNTATARSEVRFAKITDLGNRQDVAKWHQLAKDRIDGAERMSKEMDPKGPGSMLIRENLENQIRTLRSELQESQALLNHQ